MAQSFVDSHAHLDDAAFDPDRDAVVERARGAGVRYILAVGGGTGPDSLAASIPIAERWEGVYATVGLHPHDARHFMELHAEQIGKYARHPKVVAVGEIGLDFHYDNSPREVQAKVLAQQLELAREVKLPVIIHCRDAWSDLGKAIQAHWRSSGLGGILHCFSGERADAFEFLDCGFLVSFAGNLTFKKAENLRAVARAIPRDRLLTETDCPYLAPAPQRGKRNEPALVREVTRQLAALHNLTEDEMGQYAIENFLRLFPAVATTAAGPAS
jgi:TatD DNase family protein